MRAFIISCLFCVLIWFSILAIVGFMSWLKDRKRRKRMTDKISSEDFIKAFGSGVKETEHHLIKECKDCKWLGEKAITGHCIKCRDKDMWELKKGGAE